MNKLSNGQRRRKDNMIFYFAGTGNSAWVAKQLAHFTDDQACDIVNLKTLSEAQAAKRIGFVFPVYAWRCV